MYGNAISSGIVGYQEKSIKNGYAFFTVTFENITDATKFNLSDLEVLAADGSSLLRTGAAAKSCNGALYVQKISAEGNFGTKFVYVGRNATDTFGPGWYEGTRDSAGNNLVSGDAVTFGPGEGMILYTSKADDILKFRMSGGVRLETLGTSVKNGYTFGGNASPVTLNLSDVQVTAADGSALLRTGAAAKSCNGALYIQKITAEGNFGTKYVYVGRNATDTFGPGWYEGTRDSQGENLIAGDDVTFDPGEGWILYTSKADDVLKIVLPSPVTSE